MFSHSLSLKVSVVLRLLTAQRNCHCRPFPSQHALLPFREYIQSSLYHPTAGYFSTCHPPLQPASLPPLNTLRNRNEYRSRVQALYSSIPHGWLTPVELFTPHLSNAIATRIASSAPATGSVNVLEIGAGRGTLADDVLQCLQSRFESVYERVSYHIVEISSVLGSIQKSRLRRWQAGKKLCIHISDARRWLHRLSQRSSRSQSSSLKPQHCHVVATELLDNLPHDLLRNDGGDVLQAYIPENALRDCASGTHTHPNLTWSTKLDEDTFHACHAFGLTEDQRDYQPNSILSFLQSHLEHSMNDGASDVWCPTALYQLMSDLVRNVPSISFTLSDFSCFPGTISGKNAPVVQRVEAGTATVYDSVQQAPFGKVDIMFPTDFSQVVKAYLRIVHSQRLVEGTDGNPKATVHTQRDFFERYGDTDDVNRSTCVDGFNPILSDFQNVSFFLADMPAR